MNEYTNSVKSTSPAPAIPQVHSHIGNLRDRAERLVKFAADLDTRLSPHILSPQGPMCAGVSDKCPQDQTVGLATSLAEIAKTLDGAEEILRSIISRLEI